MKCVCILLMLTAVAHATPEKRFLLDTLSGLISTDTLKADLQVMLDTLGSDPTEQACEDEGHKVFSAGLIQHSVELLCHSFQSLVNHFQLVPDTTTVAPGKRFILDTISGLISTDTLKADLQVMLDTLGSDPTEQACEDEGHKVFSAGLVQHSVELMCHSFQSLVNHFQLVPDTTTVAPGKRFILDTISGLISTDTLKADLQVMLDTLGSDPTEQACEDEGHKVFSAGLIQHSVDLMCHSFQSLVNHFQLVPDTTTVAPGKRFILDTISGLISTDTLKADLQVMLDTLGSDPTEQACEDEGHKVFSAGLIQHSVELLCHSFQSLVNHFQLVPDTTTVAPGKRFILDTISGLISTDTLKADLQVMLDTLGSDPTEQACEDEGHKVFSAGLIQHSVELMCHSFQSLVNHFQLVPDTTTASTY